MIAAAERAGVTLGVVSQHRFRPTPLAAKRLIEDGVIGEVRMAQVRGLMPPWDMPRRNLPWADLGAHLCDILRWLVGSEVALVASQFHDYGPGDPPGQTAFVIVRFESGALAHIWFSYEITAARPGLHHAVPGDRLEGHDRPRLLRGLPAGQRGRLDHDRGADAARPERRARPAAHGAVRQPAGRLRGCRA